MLFRSSAPATNTYCYNGLGQTTTRATLAGRQSLTWNDEGSLQSATTGGNTSTYYYDASGAVIERSDPGATTLFLPSQQVTLNPTTGALSNVRTYALPGGGKAVLTNTTYGFELSDQHATATVTLDSTCRNPVWKQYTPYGAPRGTTPGSGWLDPNGFLGKPVDTADNLTTIGARQYDTALGRFVSLDPVLEGNPQELNGYTYAGSNPVTGSDPTGEFCDGCGPDYYSGPGCSFDSNGFSNGNCDGQGTAAPTCEETPSCRAELAAQVAAKKAHDDAVRAALAAEQKAREEAAARARAEAAAANRQCAWYDVGCHIGISDQALLEGLAVVAIVAAVVVLCVVAPEVMVAAAGAFGQSMLATGSVELASVAGVAAGVSVAAEGAGMAGVAAVSAVVADMAGGGAIFGLRLGGGSGSGSGGGGGGGGSSAGEEEPGGGPGAGGGASPGIQERAKEGVQQPGIEKTWEHFEDKNKYLADIAAKYGINLRGSGQDIRAVYDEDLPVGQEGVTRKEDGGTVIRIGPYGMTSDTQTANTIAHELNHARYFLARGNWDGEEHGDAMSMGDGTAYGAGNALQDWIEGNR